MEREGEGGWSGKEIGSKKREGAIEDGGREGVWRKRRVRMKGGGQR